MTNLTSTEMVALKNTLETAFNLCYFTNQCEESVIVCSKGNNAAHNVVSMVVKALGLKTKEAVYLFAKANKLNLMDEGCIDSLDLPRW